MENPTKQLALYMQNCVLQEQDCSNIMRAWIPQLIPHLRCGNCGVDGIAVVSMHAKMIKPLAECLDFCWARQASKKARESCTSRAQYKREKVGLHNLCISYA